MLSITEKERCQPDGGVPGRDATITFLTPLIYIPFINTPELDMLPRGERRFISGFYGLLVWFQSTLPRGERLSACAEYGGHSVFQSTLPRGERPSTELMV